MTNRPSKIVTKNKAFLDLQVDPKDDNGNLFYTVFYFLSYTINVKVF